MGSEMCIRDRYPHLVRQLSTAKSPQQMFGAVMKTYFAEKLGVSKRTISRIFSELKEQGILEQQGTRRKAKWIISKNK